MILQDSARSIQDPASLAILGYRLILSMTSYVNSEFYTEVVEAM